MIATNQLNNLNTEQKKLATMATTGKRINASQDDAAGLAIYQGMKQNLIGNNAAIQNIGHGKDLLSTQEGMMNTINSIFDRMKTLATNAADDTMSAADRAKSNKELQDNMAEIDRIANSTTYNGIKLGDGSVASVNLQVGAGTTADDKIAVTLGDMRTSAMSITGGSITSSANASTFLDNLKLDQDALATKFGNTGAFQNRLDFASKNLINMNDNLKSSMSTIMDADMAEVAAAQAKNTARYEDATNIQPSSAKLHKSICLIKYHHEHTINPTIV